jgi:hypothetical protein
VRNAHRRFGRSGDDAGAGGDMKNLGWLGIADVDKFEVIGTIEMEAVADSNSKERSIPVKSNGKLDVAAYVPDILVEVEALEHPVTDHRRVKYISCIYR